MADVTQRFREKLEGLCALGRRSGMRLSVQQIQDAMEGEHLSAEHFQMIYTYLDQMSIEIYDPDLEEGESSKGQPARSLEIYLEELEGIAPLPEDAELLLFERAAEGDAGARETLIERYLTTVCDLASEFEKAHPKVEAEDLVQEANVALVMGVGALKKEQSLAAYRVKLLNYVTDFLEESAKNLEEMTDSDVRIVNRMNKLADTIRALAQELGHKPSVDEVSAYLELPSEDIRNLLRMGGQDLMQDVPEE